MTYQQVPVDVPPPLLLRQRPQASLDEKVPNLKARNHPTCLGGCSTAPEKGSDSPSAAHDWFGMTP